MPPAERRRAPEPDLEAFRELRRAVREGGILLGADQTSLFVFGVEGRPVRRVVRYRLADRLFEVPDVHPARMAREVRALLSSVSRVEVTDLRQNAPPPGAMRDYLTAAGVQGLLSLPVRSGGEIVGFLSFESTAGPRRWSTRDRDRAHEVTRQVEELLEGEILDWIRESGPVPGARGEVEEGAEAPPPHPLPDSAAQEWTGARMGFSAKSGSLRSGVARGEDRELRARLPRLRTLEGTAVVAADLAADLLEVVQVQEGALRLLADELGEGSEGQALGEDLREASHRLERGLQEIVAMTRTGMVGRDVVELNRVLGGMIHRLAPLVGEEVRFMVSPSVDPLPVRVNIRLLERALEHVVRNARRAVRRGGRVRMSWRATRLDQAMGAAGEGPDASREVVSIGIEDDGPGIRPDDLPWVFEPYFASAADEESPGRGMGLALVQAVVEGHGGWVDLRSRLGEGTRVTLHLPLVTQASTQPVTDDDPEPEEGGGTGDAGLARILLVEDEALLARLLERVLLRAGFQVEVASTAPRARRIWQARGGAFDLVVMERRLGADGEGTALLQEWIRERADLPFLLTDRRLDPHTAPPKDLDPGALLADPFDPIGVIRRVRERLGLGAREAGDMPTHDAPSVPPPGGLAH